MWFEPGRDCAETVLWWLCPVPPDAVPQIEPRSRSGREDLLLAGAGRCWPVLVPENHAAEPQGTRVEARCSVRDADGIGSGGRACAPRRPETVPQLFLQPETPKVMLQSHKARE